MTLEDESRLSFYKELTTINSKKNIILVQHIVSRELFVKKTLDIYSKPVYDQLLNTHINGIPNIIECIKDDKQLIIIEEYINGKTLSQIINEQGLFNEYKAYNIAVKLAHILVNLQSSIPPIIHRDIKPSNIIIDKNQQLYLIDFNAARHVNNNNYEDTRMLGTVYFAAPEQYGFGQSNERTDIYGFGATINYLMTGDKPGAGIAQCDYSYILKKCLMLDAINRYQSALELLNAIKYISTNNSSAYKKYTSNSGSSMYQNIEHNVKGKNENTQNIKNIILNNYNKYIKKEQLINSSWKKYLLPGFRSFNPVFCILAAIWYFSIIYITCTLTVTSNNGINVSFTEIVIYRIIIFLILITETLWLGNYLNIQKKLPGMKKLNMLSFLLMYVYGFILLFILVFLLALIVTFLPIA
uniref:protein kinase domain-containing protein n=1 Tax=[Lactobacillus] rogosae TaxID=706562 RepID=UPI00402A8873